MSDFTWPGWETVRIIGKGSFGAVYEIKRDVFGKTEFAALKVISIPRSENDIRELRNDGYDEESITDTFKSHMYGIVNEYSMMREMKGSANIVDCDDVQCIQHEDGIGWDIFIKMELLTTLVDTLPKDIPEETAIRVGIDICKALCLCKKYDIVHRDIKPQNIFVSKFGDYKLGDFGVAKTVERTMGGTKIGTYKYMAPEVYNNRPYGAAADIYSLGLVLYWLLNERRMPFVPLPPTKMTASLEERARVRRFEGEQIPATAHGRPELQKIVLKACAFDPKDRYSSAEEMLNELELLQIKLKTGTKEEKTAAPAVETPPAEKEAEKESAEDSTALDAVQSARKDTAPEHAAPQKEIEPESPEAQEDRTVGIFGAARKAAKKETVETAAPADAASAGEETVCGFRPAAAKTSSTDQDPQAEQEQASNAPEQEQGAEDAAPAERGDAAPAPQPDVQQIPAQAPTGKKSRKGLLIALIAGAAVIAFLVIGFFTIHIWSPATCTEPETCVFCGKTRGNPEHDWESATCTQPKRCKICGVSTGKALGHKWTEATKTTPAKCTVCGATSGTVLQPVLRIIRCSSSDDSEPVCDCDGTAATLSVPSLDAFPQSKITLWDAEINEITDELSKFNISWDNATVTISPKSSLPCGVYHFVFTCNSTQVDFGVCYGYPNETYLVFAGLTPQNFALQNKENGRYLVQTGSGRELTTTALATEKTTFANNASICGIEEVTTRFAYAIVTEKVDFTCTWYTCLDNCHYYTFSYNGWYLASGTQGNVYLEKTITDSSCWLMP